ncbi:MAG: glycosyltransferase [Candidatus Kapabacteria bacterium]|nr:glycosyltransferase [Candidatus Kapabacteria bacterium]
MSEYRNCTRKLNVSGRANNRSDGSTGSLNRSTRNRPVRLLGLDMGAWGYFAWRNLPRGTMIPVVLLICALAYGLRLLYFVVGFARGSRVQPRAETLPEVTVVIPARNECETLARCVASIAASNYPAAKRRVIIVDDRSTDGTSQLLDELASRYENITALHRTEADVTANLRGKPGALQAGIDMARTDVVLMTDADCTVHPDWIRTMSAPFADERVGMVCSTTDVEPMGAFSRLQGVEWAYSHAMARGSLQNGIALGCYGNNLAVRRSTFMALGGYGAIPFSVTEDLALLQAVCNSGAAVQYLCQHDAAVTTLPCMTVGEYIRQRQRWAQGGTALGWKATAFVLTSMALWIGMIVAIATGNVHWFTGLAGMRIIGDASLVLWALARLRRIDTMLWVLPSILVLMLTEFVVPFLLLQRNVTWKGQRFRASA